jgi:hypothetical protein
VLEGSKNEEAVAQNTINSLDESLIGHWAFVENDDFKLMPDKGPKFTMIGKPQIVNENKISFINFSGTKQYVDTGATLGDLKFPFSIALWAKPKAQPSSFTNLIGNYHSRLLTGFGI